MLPVARIKKDAEGRREDILGATLELIAEKGIDQVRGADLAKRVGVSAGLIFYHFANLETLIIAAVTYAADRDLRRLDDVLADTDADVATRLRAVLHEYRPTGTAFGWRLWIEAWSASLRNADLRQVVSVLDVRWREVIAALIDEGVESGEFSCPDPGGAAWRLTSLLDGLAVQLVVFGGAVSKEQANDWVELALSRELGI